LPEISAITENKSTWAQNWLSRNWVKQKPLSKILKKFRLLKPCVCMYFFVATSKHEIMEVICLQLIELYKVKQP
jgi:hypothetical protein